MKKSEISLLNVLFCLLVIFIHTASNPVSALDKGSAAYICFFVPWRLSAFVVQGFIFLSALKLYLKPPSTNGYISYYLTKVKKIIIPYAAAVLVFYCYFVHHGYFPFRTADLLKYIFGGELVSHFYFVIVIVQFYLLKPLWDFTVRKTKDKTLLQIGICIAAFVMSAWFSQRLPYLINRITGKTFVYNDRIFSTYLVYWVGGMFAGANYEKFKEIISDKRKIFCIIYPIAALCEVCIAYKGVREYVSYAETMHFVYCIIAILFCFSVGTGSADKFMKNKFIQKINGASYYIYLIHPLFIFESDRVALMHGITSVSSAFLIRFAASYILSLGIAFVCAGIKNKKRGKIC